MRKIKFRALLSDKYCKERNIEKIWNYSGDFAMEKKWKDGKNAEVRGMPEFFTVMDLGAYDRKTLTQYTGIKDKNGKEIYEGDIVNIKHPDDMCGDFANTSGDVFWSDMDGGWYHGNSNGRPPKKMWEYCEVIGNIYEDKELLK